MTASDSPTAPQALLGPMRLPFLILTPACVLLGIGAAFYQSGRVDLLQVVIVLIGALAAHISVNALNEYFDFRSGLDLRTQRTPFSGGSGTLAAQPAMAPKALATGLVAMAVTAGVGLYFVFVRGAGLLPLGLAGLLIIAIYTVWLTRYPLLCLIAPGLGFGTFMVMGTSFALTGQYSWTAFVASLVPFFLVNNLLLLNQFPDVEADRSIGRKHFPIVIGRRASSWIYIAFLILTYTSIAGGVLVNLLPAWALLGLLTLPLAIAAGRGAHGRAEDISNLVPFMVQNVLLNIVTPVLMAIGLFLG
ncbi:MAG TPA: prenyltransferase [Anaerolineales bacterium]|nr:prenyltransferase [Anaerolineales bacterium]